MNVYYPKNKVRPWQRPASQGPNTLPVQLHTQLGTPSSLSAAAPPLHTSPCQVAYAAWNLCRRFDSLLRAGLQLAGGAAAAAADKDPRRPHQPVQHRLLPGLPVLDQQRCAHTRSMHSHSAGLAPLQQLDVQLSEAPACASSAHMPCAVAAVQARSNFLTHVNQAALLLQATRWQM